LVGVEQWAEVRRMKRVEGSRRGRSLAGRGWPGTRWAGCWRQSCHSLCPLAVRLDLDPFKEWICEELKADPKVPSQRLRELAEEIGYRGGKTVFDDYVARSGRGS